MSIDRALVIAVIRAVRDAVLRDRQTGVGRASDPEAREIVRRACAAHAITVEEWAAWLTADVDLGRLFDKTLDELLTDPPDPGPYDEISRESQYPAPQTEALERDQRVGGPLRELGSRGPR